MGMGGLMGGGTGGGASKASSSANATGQPSWGQNGAQGNSMAAAGGNAAATGAGGVGGANPDYMTPGTEAYNNMNTALTTGPMAALTKIFQNGGMTGEMSSVMQNLLGSNGSNALMDSAAKGFQDLGTTGTANFQNLYDKAGQAGNAETNLADIASGKMLMSNPYLDKMVQQGQDEAGTGVNQMFAAGGRYGGGVNQGTLADSYQKIGNQFRGEQWNNDANRQLQASGLISDEQRGRMGLQSGAAQGVGNLQQASAQGLGGLGQNQFSNWLNAQTGGANLSNQGVQNQFGGMDRLKSVQDNKMYDTNVQAGVGEETTDSAQGVLDDLVNQWGQGDMEGWARLGGLLSAGTGSAGSWGTGTSSTNQSSQAGAGSIIGGLLSLFSDRRMKQDIVPTGGTLAGLPLYAFRYRHDPQTPQIGVMSDEVREVYPEAVSVADNGFDMVDYGVLISRELAL